MRSCRVSLLGLLDHALPAKSNQTIGISAAARLTARAVVRGTAKVAQAITTIAATSTSAMEVHEAAIAMEAVTCSVQDPIAMDRRLMDRPLTKEATVTRSWPG